MKFGIRSRILVVAIVLSIIFLLISRTLLEGIIINTYWEERIQDVITKVSIELNRAEINDDYESVSKKLIELKKENKLIKGINIVDEKEIEKINGKSSKGGVILRQDVHKSDNEKEVDLYFKLKLNNALIKITLVEPDIIFKEIMFNTTFKIIATVIVLFNILFALIIGKFITKRVTTINSLSKEMIKRNSVIKIAKDMMPDEFDELTETLNEFTQNFSNDIQELERERLYKKQLMLSLSHEIKTPIGGLNGILEGMLDNVPPYTDREKYIRECRKLSSKLGNIANEMLDITKLDSVPTGKKEVIVRILIEEIWDELRILSLTKRIVFINKMDIRITIFTDEILFKRSIVNIIENAIKYAKEGTGILVKSTGYIISVYNECDKLTKEDLNFVFKPLYRGSNREIADGRGIGLYIVKECLIALNISFKLENYKEGVVFKMNLQGEDKWE
ncbi:HAMP domain-containing sensor histidine kinase [uncultured Clostridium sp.]|uniref:sensor histidine kinase n=1 Tax=uncultured Clostridium sp. TaxID=59620 RepID=UPI00261D396A|nr:HAMP domain-containing sensor histidine kinase [uncultured Clostridium sp.]